MLLLVLFAFLAIVNSQSKFCVNCKYFMKHGFFTSDEFGRCQKYPIILDTTDEYLVTGYSSVVSETDYHYCSTVRSSGNKCGPTGKDYKKKYKKRGDESAE